MSDYQITLQPVYSCPATKVPPGLKLPENWTLSWHQVETLEAIRNPEIDVIFNTAMTGDGKSLAAYLDTLQGYPGFPCAMGLYPTNELARDQERQVKGYIELFYPPLSPPTLPLKGGGVEELTPPTLPLVKGENDLLRVTRLSGEELEIYAEKEGLKKAKAIETRSHNSEILLTNPDIFHYLHRGAYLMPKENPDRLWGRIDKDFDLFIFDEFHVFSAPQIASVINTLLLIRFTNRRKKFLFLSATPNKKLLESLTKTGFKCQEINPLANNKYKFNSAAEGWRKVAGEISLNFISLEPTFQAAESWLKENNELVLAYFKKNPNTKGAIILNSLAAVKRLIPFFRSLFECHGLTVGENTGLSGKQEKERSLTADLVIGTSTIDVGVDFKINLLIFEAADAGNFIQRLGRLGRHDGYEKEGKFIEFNKGRSPLVNAIALSPNFLVERLFLGETAPLKVGESYERPFFHNQITENYRQINDFSGYYSRWGAVQSMVLCRNLGKQNIKQQYQGSQKAFQQACELVFNTKLSSVYGRSKGWEKEWQKLSGKDKGNPIKEEACSFRGSSLLQCGIYDVLEANDTDRFKTYDLPGILSNLEIEPMSEAEFMRKLQETKEKTQQPIAKGRFQYCLAFMKLLGYREERLNWKFTYAGDLQPIMDAGKVQVLTGLQIWQPDNPWVGVFNKSLKKQGLVCYVLGFSATEVRRRLHLPMHFQIYPICDGPAGHGPQGHRRSAGDISAPYSIVFGQSALLLDTLAYFLKSKKEETWIV